MNILPKKSWHVRTKKNIERVRRDEANAAEEEKKLKRRIQLAEQEARTELLRKRAKSGYAEKDDDTSSLKTLEDSSSLKTLEDSSKHLNFFQDIEKGGGFIGGVNKEHEEEEKAIKEKFEKDIGLLTYLGQSSTEAKGEVPWYLKSSMKDSSTTDGEDETASSKHKSQIDPLNDMKKFLALKEKKHEKDLFVYKKVDDKKSKEIKRVEPEKKLSKIEELRAKRLKREAEERKRSQKFLESLRTGKVDSEPEVILDDRARKYNSQFNPHLVRNKHAFSKNYDSNK